MNQENKKKSHLKVKNLSINLKLMLSILSAAVVIFAAAISYIALQTRKLGLEDAKAIADTYAFAYANKAKANLNTDMNIARGIAHAFKGYVNLEYEERTDIHNDILYYITKENENFLSVWANWELRAISDWDKPYGRARFTYFRENGNIEYKTDTLNRGGDDPTSAYYKMKVSKQETVMEPYYYSYSGKEEDKILETSVCVPILNNDDEFMGLAGIDLALGRFEPMLEEIKPFDSSYAILLSNHAVIIGHPNDTTVGKPFSEMFTKENEKFNVTENVKEGVKFSYLNRDPNTGALIYTSFAPIYIGKSITPWSLGIKVPVSIITASINKNTTISVIVGVIGLLLLSFLIFYISRQITSPILSTTQTLLDIANTGDVENTKKLTLNTKDELGQMAYGVNKLMDSLKKTAEFANDIGNNKLDVSFKSLGEKDVLGNALLEMRQSLMVAKKEEENRKQENQIRSWTNQGIAKFSDILRKDNDNIKKLSFILIKNIVQYLNANQGGIFIVNNESEHEKHLELTAAYAFDRQKFLHRKIEPGEGLVGACFLEKKPVYLDEIPQNYISITSGLGDANPGFLAIIPLELNNEVFGILELASFNMFKDYEREFLNIISESIASTISSAKVNERTAMLLQKSQEQAEQMKAQEEEMRQNMEELHATQEEMQRKNAETESVMDGISKTQAIIEFNLQGRIVNANEKVTEITGYNTKDIRGKNHREFVQQEVIDSGKFDEIWNKLKDGLSFTDVFEHETPKGTVWTLETYTPIKNSNGKISKVMLFMMDISEQKKLEEKSKEQLEMSQMQQAELRKHQAEMKGVLEALNATTNMVEYDLEGNIVFVNDSYLEILNRDYDDVVGEHHSFMMKFDAEKKNDYEQFWNDLLNGHKKKEINIIERDNEQIYLLETYTPVRDEAGNVYKILKIAIDITESKKMEMKIEAHQDEIKNKEKELKDLSDELNAKDEELSDLAEQLQLEKAKFSAANMTMDDDKKALKMKIRKLQEEITRLKS